MAYPTPMPILLAEDSAVIQTVLRGMLSGWGYEVVVAANGVQAWEILCGETPPRIAIVDWMMPLLKGPELCRRLRAEVRGPYTYVLLLTSRSDCADIVEGLDAGADDYLTKPFHAQELRARIRAGSRIVQLQAQLLTAREELIERATVDDLTKLLNRGAILDRLDGAVERADREGQPLSILLADIDRFRQINDTFGHLAGDLVLRECGRRIRAAAPESASIGRYSGEEFLLVLPETGRPEAVEIGGRIRSGIASPTFHAGAASFPVTCSVGVACRATPDGAAPASLLRAADDALLAAKAEARERVASALRASAALMTAVT